MADPKPTKLGDSKRAAEIMIPLDKYPWVRVGDSLKHAVSVIEEAQLEVGLRRSLPRVLLVFDSKDELAGVVRRRDIMRGLEPEFLLDHPLEYRVRLFEVAIDPHLTELSGDASLEMVVKGLQEQGKRPVADVLRPISATLKPDDPIMKVIYEMVSLNESLIPVVDGQEVLGVIRSVDVFHELAQLLS